MANSDFMIVILAAGKGTRLKSALAKVLHRAGGRPLVEQVVRACQPIKTREIVAVVGHQADDVTAAVAPLGVRTILQEPQRGTGHAMLVAKRAIPTRAKFVIILPGDAPLIRTETIAALARSHRESGAAATILSAEIENPSGYGRIVRHEDGSVLAIVEDSALSPEQRPIREINSSMYCFTLAKLWPCLSTLKPTNKHKELYLTDAIAVLRQKGEKVQAVLASDSDEVLGCNTRADLAEVDLVFRKRKRAAIMDAGVTIELPDTVLIDPEVTVEADSRLEPGVQLLGKTRVGAGCTIRTGSVLSDAVLEDNVLVKPYTMITASHLSRGTQVGPFAHIRESARLEENARVGNFVEVKKSVLGEGVKSMHLTYLGDARIGSKTNIGAGTITCNYDGVNKNPTTIGKGVFIGSDTALVAPVRVGDGAYIGAGSVITKDVPADALGLARGKQMNKLGWAVARRKEMAAASKSKKSGESKKTKRKSK
ncbi:MAG TPA: bifunctional UDP-N-acetylglucosamine diphosphorylase/glucosamine-1-phosphate N-acetyltransferase GlmU [Candidatus Acidoferrales bacterium]|jgi:bifunctional UDP-N-acetylglucosamine pyrophosphorylase/glucosamine-1-phosphate N-acetyltransferase|nr:bifunctional UDP-N-acetylglucosamine diphosphorylase/glucosamine-1-phosphate N-acetyltransferase GlmU [Candidatus Acidoferrales bacterium]